jgi:hypothetical protein
MSSSKQAKKEKSFTEATQGHMPIGTATLISGKHSPKKKNQESLSLFYTRLRTIFSLQHHDIILAK